MFREERWGARRPPRWNTPLPSVCPNTMKPKNSKHTTQTHAGTSVHWSGLTPCPEQAERKELAPVLGRRPGVLSPHHVFLFFLLVESCGGGSPALLPLLPHLLCPAQTCRTGPTRQALKTTKKAISSLKNNAWHSGRPELRRQTRRRSGQVTHR